MADGQAFPGGLHATDFSCQRVGEVKTQDRKAWQALVDCDETVASPLLGPEFADLVASVRSDVRIVMAHRGGRLCSVLAVHKRPGGRARPLGAPFNDYSGPIVAPGAKVDLAAMLRACGLKTYSAASCVSDADRLENAAVHPAETAFVIHLAGRSPAEYLEHFRSSHAKRHKNFRRLLRRLEEDGALELVAGLPDPQHLEQLFAWKSEQFRRDGRVDIIHTPHSRAILQAAGSLTPQSPGALQGYMISLVLDGQLLAGHFGVRRGDAFHPWISAFNPAHGEDAPGILLIYRAIERMQELGLETYDLSGGHDHYKKYFADPLHATFHVEARTGALSQRLGQTSDKLWQLAGSDRDDSAAARLRRRLDHIATCEPRPGARLSELITALRKRL